MLSRLSYVPVTSRVVRTWRCSNRRSIGILRLCKSLSTTCSLCSEDEHVNFHSKTAQNLSPSSNNNIPTVNERLVQMASHTAEKYVGVDVPKVLDEFFQKAKCHGCGTIFQSEDHEKPGFINAAKNPALNNVQGEADSLKPVVCERCFNLQHYNKGSPVLSSPNEVVEFLGHISRQKALVLYMVDILDLPGSMVTGLLDIVGPAKRIIVVANKLDMLPLEGKPRLHLEDLHTFVWHQCKQHDLQDANIKDVCLISTKTGFGIPKLVDQILEHWDEKGDVYVVGSTNTGKTSLFNALLDLTNVHKKKGDMIHRATVSRLPGTTLSLLRFACGHWKLTKLKNRLHDGTAKVKIACHTENMIID